VAVAALPVTGEQSAFPQKIPIIRRRLGSLSSFMGRPQRDYPVVVQNNIP
jgi:hypothetical protein